MPTELIPNPAAWVTTAIAKNFDRIANHVEDPALMPLMEAARAQGKRLVIEIPEYGCGAYGCVMPTLDEDVVFKITTDQSEAEFIEKVLPGIEPPPPGLIEYFDVLRLQGHHKNYPLYAVWREEAYDVGELEQVYPGKVGPILDLIYYQKSAGSMAFALLRHAENAAELYEEALIHRLEAREIMRRVPIGSSESPATMIAGRYQDNHPMLLACCLASHEVCATLLAADPALRAVGQALLTFLANGVLIGDAHVGNMGRAKRDDVLTWVITDPGHVAVLGTPWRNASDVVAAEAIAGGPGEHRRHKGRGRVRKNYATPEIDGVGLISNPAGLPLPSSEAVMALLSRLIPTAVAYMVEVVGSFKSCGQISQAMAEAATAEGIPAHVTSRPGHFFNVFPVDIGGAIVVDVTQLQFSLPCGSPRDTDDPIEKAQVRTAMAEALEDPMTAVTIKTVSPAQLARMHLVAPDPGAGAPMTIDRMTRAVAAEQAERRGRQNPARRNPAPGAIQIDPEDLEDMHERSSFFQGAVAKVQAAANEAAAGGAADGEGLVFLSDVTEELGTTVPRLSNQLAHWNHLGWLTLGYRTPTGDAATYAEGFEIVGYGKVNAIVATARAAATTPRARSAAVSPGSTADAARVQAVADELSAQGAGYMGSEKIYLASVADAMGTTVAALAPAIEAWRRQGWITVTRNDLPLPQYQDLIRRSELGTGTHVVHFILATTAAPRGSSTAARSLAVGRVGTRKRNPAGMSRTKDIAARAEDIAALAHQNAKDTAWESGWRDDAHLWPDYEDTFRATVISICDQENASRSLRDKALDLI